MTGTGSIIAIIDTGIDQDSPEFAGRIHSASADVAGNRGINAVDDHGTNVALVAAAARDNTGVLGIAWNAQLLVARADDPGTCDGNGDCAFDDSSIAAGIDLAVRSGADVINISLGGGWASQALLAAVARAASAGVVIVVSAGNGGDGSEPGIDPNQPDPFASSLLAAGNGNVIIVGSIDENGAFSDFSNRAGSNAASFLAARGEAICCVYQNGQLFVETINGQQFVTLFSGTSFSAPQVAGAVALLAQAFPNLTGQQIVEILLESARDAGAMGTDAVFGRGILDIARAFAPSGTTSLAGTGHTLALADNFAIGSAAMGDALAGQGVQAIVLDRYQRAFTFDLTGRMRSATATLRLHGAVERRGRAISGQTDGMALAFTVGEGARAAGVGWASELRLSGDDADKAQVLAARIAARIAPGTEIGIAYAQGAGGLVAQLQRSGSQGSGPHGSGAAMARPAFLIAPDARGESGFIGQSDIAFALRHQAGPWGLTVFGEEGDAYLAGQRRLDSIVAAPREQRPVHSMGLAIDRRFGTVESGLTLSWLAEQQTVLGAWFHESLGGHGADSAFADISLRSPIGSRWQLGGTYRQGMTMARTSQLITSGSRLWSNAWSLDISRQGTVVDGDSMGFRISQPLRVTSGGLLLNLPVGFDYATETPEYGLKRLTLAPDGRELLGELAWRGPLLWGQGGMSVFYRHQPGHYAQSPADVGAAISWNAEF